MSRMALPREPGRELFDGRYRLESVVGTGGMATVWRAMDESLGRVVAIKMLAERYSEDESFVERFRREAQSAAGLNHPNIVSIYDRGEADGSYYIAMEYLDGRSLKDEIVEDGPLPAPRAIDYALQILQALRFAHRNGVVHRDIKPDNIIVGRDRRLKVTDFGIARAGASQMTEVGSIIGTAQYLSPEQARGQQVRPPADLYSLGVVLYEMLTGRVPFDGDSAVAIAMKHVSENPRPPRELNPSIPPALEQVVLRALAKDPALRYQSAEDMAADLERVRRGASVAHETQALTQVLAAETAATRVVAPEPPPVQRTRIYEAPPVDEVVEHRLPPQPPPKRSVWPWVVLLLLLLAVGALAAVVVPDLIGGGNDTQTKTQTQATTVKVPADLNGKTLEQAQAALRSAGLKPGPTQKVRANAEANIVVDSDPAGGTVVARGRTVKLQVSKGLKTLPDVTGTQLDAATSALSDAGWEVDTPDLVQNDAPANEVLDEQPAAGRVPVGTVIHLKVSKGPAQVEVPDVSGRSKSDARAALEAQGFTVGGTTSQPSDSVTSGDVVATRPSAGSKAPKGSEVDLIVSSGPQRVEVPDETGKTEEEAVSELQGLGLNPQPGSVEVTDPAQDGVVQRQSPIGGNHVLPGSKVIVVIGRLAVDTTTDTTVTDTTTDTTATVPTP
jgi:beta-lactam-binding protein with PASTA domain/predicted Ser/Thr protein kinase